MDPAAREALFGTNALAMYGVDASPRG